MSGPNGMDIRDWFAGQALTALVAYAVKTPDAGIPEDVAEEAYAYADAMLAARERVRMKPPSEPPKNPMPPPMEGRDIYKGNRRP